MPVPRILDSFVLIPRFDDKVLVSCQVHLKRTRNYRRLINGPDLKKWKALKGTCH
jgi:hypothetical protein